MRKVLLITVLSLMMFGSAPYAQNVFNPNDPIVNYDPNNPPATPPANTIAKWVRTPHPHVTWNTSKFKAYYYNGIAFRMRFPTNYDPNNTSKKYPVIFFMHGGGEIGPVTDNEFHLLLGAQMFEKMMDNGASGYVLKNATQNELMEAINTVITGKTYLSFDASQTLVKLKDHAVILTRRELEVLELIAEGMTNNDIAGRLFISSTTVDTHRKNLLSKFGVKNTASLIRMAVQMHLIE